MTATSFSYTGAAQSFVVPANVSALIIECWGAQGGDYYNSGVTGVGGYGGYAKGTVVVTPGETLQINVGGKPAASTATGGWNGGGAGYWNGSNFWSGPGGGATDVRRGGTALANRIMIGGGGGGSGNNDPSYPPGAGGGTNGGNGTQAYGGYIAYGGSQSAGGAAPPGNTAGSLGQGGDNIRGGGSGGGGGYYGGAAGAGFDGSTSFAGSGGGGSGYVTGTSTTNTSAVRSGNGLVTLTYITDPLPPTAPNLVIPALNQVVSAAAAVTFDWDFLDPNTPDGDVQTAYRLRRKRLP
jgi:hypothetical protein